MKTALTLACLLCLAGASAAGEVEEAADRVLAAIEAGKPIAKLAAADEPDPWRVADELGRRGAWDAALAFAKAAPRPDTEKLPAYVEAARGREDEPGARAALAAYAKAYDAKKSPAQQLATLDGVAAMRGDFDEARKHFEGALEEAREAGMKAFVAKIQLNLVFVFARQAEYDASIKAGEEARAVFEALNDELHGGMVRSELAGTYLILGDLARAKQLFGEAAEILGRLRHPNAAVARTNPAAIDAMTGNVRGAVDKYRELSDLFLRRQDFHRAAQCRSGLAKVYSDLADFDRAIEEFRRAIAMLERVGDKAEIANIHCNLGGARAAMGRNDLALRHYEAAGDIYREIRTPKGEANVLAALGSLYWTIGQDERGEKLLREAQAIYRRIGNHGDAARVTGALAAVFVERGRYEEAVEDLKTVLASYRRAGVPGAEANALYNLGVAYSHLDEYEDGLRAMEQAVAKFEQVGDLDGKAVAMAGAAEMHEKLGRTQDAFRMFEASAKLADEIGAHRALMTVLTSEARARLVAGDSKKALAAAERALASLPDLVRGLSDEEGASARSAYGNVFEVGAIAALRESAAAAACRFLESGRAGSLEALGGRDGLRGAVVPEELHIAEARARKAVAAAEERIRSARKSGNFKEARAAREAVDEARTALFDVQNRIRREAKRAANVLYPTVKSLAEIQATLREDEAFVAYGLFRRSLALVVRSDGARVVALPDGEEIEAACRALALHDRDKDGAEAVAMLREDVAAPLKIEESVKRILLSPHGALAYVPGALLFPDREVAHLPSGTTYLHLREHGPAAGTKVLALGDPDYKSKEEGGGFRKVGRTRLKPLPATRAEVEAVGSVKLLGASATEAGVREALAGEECWRAVHFACHGLLNAEHPRLSALAVTESGEDDGLLTVLETYRMDVPADLVVLSACETGRGKLYKAEGVVGFTRAFMFAGAPRVVVSLWEVDDEATSALMVKFYETWKKGASVAAALREAQDFVKSKPKWSHPHFWAAWQLWGLPE